MSQILPFRISKKAVSKVTNPLPAPTICPYCKGSKIEIKNNSAIYNGREYGAWPWVYLCTNCRAYVGLHPGTDIPLGTLADKMTREARQRCKAPFNRLWKDGPLTRVAAYRLLADKLGIEHKHCHFGWFDAETCERARVACELVLSQIHNSPKPPKENLE